MLGEIEAANVRGLRAAEFDRVERDERLLDDAVGGGEAHRARIGTDFDARLFGDGLRGSST